MTPAAATQQPTPPWESESEVTQAPAGAGQGSTTDAEQEPQDEYAMGAELDADSSFGSSMPPHMDDDIPL